ncbi:MAG TPA: Uma2 family endonuclease [Allocoleopsis sp.]
MIITPVKPQLTFDQFITQLPDEEGRFEFVNGEIMRILPTRHHEDIADFLIRQFDREIERLKLNYRVSGRIVIRTLTNRGKEQGRNPDVSVIDKTIWTANRHAYSAIREPLQLAVEVVSTNWEDDYFDKLSEYQNLCISEYWIVDYLGLGSRDLLGNPKLPSIFVYLLDENGVYQSNRYQDTDKIISRTFPELNITVNDILSGE